MEGEVVSLKVDPSLVTSILEKQIQTAIVKQLGNQDELIGQAVKLALSEKVDRQGNSNCRYESDRKHDFLEILATNSIQKAAKAALNDWLEQNSKKIREAVLKEIDSPERQKSIAKAYADAIESSMTNKWNMNCSISFKEREE